MSDTPTPASPSSRASNPTPPRPRRRSLVQLVTEVPQQLRELVRAEIDLVKIELIAKLKALGIGAGILVGALAVLLYMIGTLITAGILALSLVLPGWLAALLVAALLLVIAVILGLVGYRVLRRGIPPIPTEGIESLKKDVQSIRGLRKRGNYR